MLENLKKIREDSGLSYKEMAIELGVTTQYYWMIENGKRGLSYEMAINISKIFKMTPDEIFLI